jgi:hypothetical protein
MIVSSAPFRRLASTLRRDDLGTILDKLAFLGEQVARVPTRADLTCIALRAWQWGDPAAGAIRCFAFAASKRTTEIFSVV